MGREGVRGLDEQGRDTLHPAHEGNDLALFVAKLVISILQDVNQNLHSFGFDQVELLVEFLEGRHAQEGRRRVRFNAEAKDVDQN